MGPSAAGAVVLITFPFSDLSDAKVRPAVALAPAGRGDWIVRQVTSRPYGDETSIQIQPEDFSEGSLNRVSYVRPLKLFTTSPALLHGEVGVHTVERTAQIVETIARTLVRGIWLNPNWMPDIDSPLFRLGAGQILEP